MTLPVPLALPIAESPAAVVIGGANVDFKCQTLDQPIYGTSNPGRNRTSLGGVGRNIAENLARLGVRTALVTAIGDDANGTRVLSEAEAAGVETRFTLKTPLQTGTYVAILDEDGDMIIAVSTMEALEEITPSVIDSRRELIARAQLLVLDCNVPQDALLRAATIAAESSVPVIVDPVSVPKAARIIAMLDAGLPLHTITPNMGELRTMIGSSESAKVDLRAAAADIHSRGVRRVWVRLGINGSFLSSMHDGNQQSEHIAAYETKLVDATGAGDAMLAGYAAGLLGGLDAVRSAIYGSAAAALTVESAHTVNPSINFTSLAARVGSYAGGSS